MRRLFFGRRLNKIHIYTYIYQRSVFYCTCTIQYRPNYIKYKGQRRKRRGGVSYSHTFPSKKKKKKKNTRTYIIFHPSHSLSSLCCVFFVLSDWNRKEKSQKFPSCTFDSPRGGGRLGFLGSNAWRMQR